MTVAHHPSASNNYYWPELYTDMPIVWSDEGTRPHPYLDTPRPRRFGTVSPLDPEVFSDVAGFVAGVLAREPDGRMSPIEVADRLDALAQSASRRIDWIEANIHEPEVDARRWIVDVGILAALGRFFAAKLRSAVWYELFTETGDPESLRLAVAQLSAGRAAWLDASKRATGIYVPDLTFGPEPRLRGHWTDRLPAIDADLRDMRERLDAAAMTPPPARSDAVHRVMALAARQAVDVAHEPPDAFVPGTPLGLRVEVCGDGADRVAGIRVRYRPMNQALSVRSLEMDGTDGGFGIELPGAELNGEYPLAYAFEIRDQDGMAWRHPGLGRTLSEQPYVVIRPRREGSSDGA